MQTGAVPKLQDAFRWDELRSMCSEYLEEIGEIDDPRKLVDAIPACQQGSHHETKFHADLKISD